MRKDVLRDVHWKDSLSSRTIEARVMPDNAGLGETIIQDSIDGVELSSLDMNTDGSGGDTRRAAEILRSEADAVIVLGGDGTHLTSLTLSETSQLSVSPLGQTTSFQHRSTEPLRVLSPLSLPLVTCQCLK